MPQDSSVTIHDLQPSTESYLEEVIRGLRQTPKRLPSKLFYDERGSQLFEEICQLGEYYLTRTELAIMQSSAAEMAGLLGRSVVLIELGSGASVKTRILLDHLDSPVAYVPVDISRDHLEQSAQQIADAYPDLEVLPVCADFTQPFGFPDRLSQRCRRVVYFPGSTIGNFDPPRALSLLQNIPQLCGSDGALLIGIDLKKDPLRLHAAYNDAQGVTAEFNLNMLRRLNEEMGANFDLGRFAHRAFYNARDGRVEMHLVSRAAQDVQIDGQQISLEDGETICTEYSYKYDLQQFSQLAAQAGLKLENNWTDDAEMFGVLYLTVAESG